MGRVGYPPVREIQVTTERKTQLLDITAKVREAVGSDAEGSAALVYVPHTTAGVTINEKIDPDLLDDFEMALGRDRRRRLVVEARRRRRPQRALAPARLGARPAGARSRCGSGELALGTYQGIFFCEFDGPRSRKVYVSTLDLIVARRRAVQAARTAAAG